MNCERQAACLARLIFYIAKFEEAVDVLHAFEKRTRQTAQRDIELAKTRLADLIKERAKKPKKREKGKSK